MLGGMFMKNNLIEEKSFKFSIFIIQLYRDLIENKNEFILSKQLLKSGTSIGANVKEALRGQSKRDFLSKMNISLKEANECEYWIKLLVETEYLQYDTGNLALNQCNELCRILNSIVKTTQKSINE